MALSAARFAFAALKPTLPYSPHLTYDLLILDALTYDLNTNYFLLSLSHRLTVEDVRSGGGSPGRLPEVDPAV